MRENLIVAKLSNTGKGKAEAPKESGEIKHEIEESEQQTRMILLKREDITGNKKQEVQHSKRGRGA